jgi:putative transposase
VTSSEDGTAWLGFFRDLTARGLSGVMSVTPTRTAAGRGDRCDASGAAWQRSDPAQASSASFPTGPPWFAWSAPCSPSKHDEWTEMRRYIGLDILTKAA